MLLKQHQIQLQVLSVNLHSQLRDKAKHTATLIQEITEELQAIEEESSKEDQDSRCYSGK